ncbi:MAG: alpha/beta fold hydrolase [Pseudomonadota bacterium]
MKPIAKFLAALISLAAWHSAPASAQEKAPVGMTKLTFEDAMRLSWDKSSNRPLVTTIWYPAPPETDMMDLSFPDENPIFTGGAAAWGVPIAAEQRYPLVILSHGTGGSGVQTMWLGRALAEAGFIAIAIDHHGNTAAEASFDPRGFRMPWHRAMDVSVVLDEIIAHAEWAPLIDQDRISMVGFSLGGYTAIALAGGRTDLDRMAQFCASDRRDGTCDPQPEYPEAEADFLALLEGDADLMQDLEQSGRDFSDARIKKFVTLAPAVVQAFTDQSLSNISVPVLAIVGTSDRIAPAATNAERVYNRVAGADLKIIDGAGHYAFLNRCTPFGELHVPICKDPGRARGDIHAAAMSAILAFLEPQD